MSWTRKIWGNGVLKFVGIADPDDADGASAMPVHGLAGDDGKEVLGEAGAAAYAGADIAGDKPTLYAIIAGIWLAATQGTESHLGEVGGNIAKFQAQFGPAGATTFTNGQVLLATTEVTGMGRVNGGTGLLVGAAMELAAANVAEVDLVFFSSQPSGIYTAGAAFTLNAADRAKVSKVIKLTDWTALGASDSLGEATPGPKFYGCADVLKPTSLWVVAVARGSITLASATDGTLTIRGARN